MLRRAAQNAPIIRLCTPRTISRQYAAGPESTRSRIDRIESRLPRFLSRIVTPLHNAPISHVSAFLILHEITAVVPLFGLAAAFHYYEWLPPYISEGKWVKEGTEKFGRWAKKRGWVTEDQRSGRWWGRSEGGVRVIVELATAYAVTKALLPLRLVISVWATPWFARWTTLPITNALRRLFTRNKSTAAVATAAGGTGATEAGVLPKEKVQVK